MKRIFASIGLVAVGASSLHAQYSPGLTASERTKLVSLSGSLRGFYDDNYLTQTSQLKESSWGLEVSPSISLNKSTATTLFSASALYDFKHFVKNDVNDHSVQVNGLIDHKFTENQRLKVKDSFVVAQEPAVLESVVQSTPLRTAGSNLRNTASVDYLADLNRLLAVEVTYDATVYRYRDPIRKPTLNRLEQLAGLDGRFKFTPSTTGVLGYHFGNTAFSDRLLNNTVLPAKVRDNNSHFLLAGLDSKITPELTGSIRVGAQIFDYYNLHQAPGLSDKTQVSPYADASLSYNYAVGSYVQAGVKHLHNATDILGNSATSPVLDAESTVAYLSLTQPLNFISPDLTAGIYGSYQHSKFNDGALTEAQRSEDFYTASGNLAYRFNPNLSAEVGYNYDQASSAFRPFDRNRVYFGIRATY